MKMFSALLRVDDSVSYGIFVNGKVKKQIRNGQPVVRIDKLLACFSQLCGGDIHQHGEAISGSFFGQI